MNEHGTRKRYGRGCRCDECRRANTRYQVTGKHSRRNELARHAERIEVDGRLVHPNPYGGHGSVTAYTSCGCRCDACRMTWTAYTRTRRADRRA